MSDILQSGRELATQFGEKIKASVEWAGNLCVAIMGQTNLQVVDQLNAACDALKSCYSDFKGLVESDADSIPGLQEALEEFDTALSANGEVD